jgi:hypothetical protein
MSVIPAASDWPYIATGSVSAIALLALCFGARRDRGDARPPALKDDGVPGCRPASSTPPTPAHLPVLPFDMLIDRTGTEGRLTAIREKLAFAPQNYERDVVPLLRSFAEFVQLLPASESHHHAQPGGLLAHLLEVAQYAVHYRDAYKLPLLHDIGKPVADVRVDLSDDGGTHRRAWVALAGSMAQQQATWYSVSFPQRRDYEAHQRLPVILLQRFVPGAALTWLGEHPPLLQELMGYLSGDKAGGLIAEIVQKADRRSVADNLATGPRTRFVSARSVPLIERLMDALRRVLAEGGMPMNRAGATGYCDGESLWCVAGSVAKSVREYLEKHEQRQSGAAGIPEDNTRLFDTWQEYGALIPSPNGGAIWSIRVRIGEWEQPFTVLRFPLKHLYATSDRYPASLPAGAITPAEQAPAANSHPALVRQPTPALSDSSVAADVPCAQADAHLQQAATATGAACGVEANTPEDLRQSDAARAETSDGPTHDGYPEFEEPSASSNVVMAAPAQAAAPTEAIDDYPGFLIDADSATSVAASRVTAAPVCDPPTTPIAPIRPKQRELTVPAESLAVRPAGLKSRPNAQRFMAWVQQGIADGSVEYNEAGAFIHFVPEGMLVVSPKAFREFATRFEASIEPGDGGSAREPWQQVQRDFQRSGYALRVEGGTFMHFYNVSGPGGKRLVGQLVAQPERLFSQVPPSNPLLQSKAKTRIEHGLSD